MKLFEFGGLGIDIEQKGKIQIKKAKHRVQHN